MINCYISLILHELSFIYWEKYVYYAWKKKQSRMWENLVRISKFCITKCPLWAVLRIFTFNFGFLFFFKSSESESLGSFAFQFVVGSCSSSSGRQSKPFSSLLLFDVDFGVCDNAESCLPLQQFLIQHLTKYVMLYFLSEDASAVSCNWWL